MTQQHDPNDDLDGALRRMEAEFGRRSPPEGAAPHDPTLRPAPPGPQPTYGPPPQPTPPPQGGRAQAVARPVVTYVLLGAIAAMYLLSGLLSGSLFQPSLAALVFLGAKQNQLIEAGELWRLVGAMFLHGNLVHIFFNSYALFALGPESERIYGRPRFLAIYFLAGIGGSVASFLLSPAVSVGASGAIFGLMGALGLFFYLNRTVFGQAARAQVQSIVAIGLINLLIGFSSPGVIDNFGHLGGLLAGLLAAYALAPRFAVDFQTQPPTIERRHPAWGWGAAAALGLALVLMAAFLPGAR